MTTISTSKRPQFLLSIDVKTCYDRLVAASVGDIIPYEQLEALVGRTVRDKGAWILASARRRAFTQNSMLFGTISKVGLKRLNDQEIVDTATDAVLRIHQASLRAARRLTAVRDFDSLDAKYKMRHDVGISALALLAHITKEGQMKKLETAVSKSLRTLPLQKTLEAFRE